MILVPERAIVQAMYFAMQEHGRAGKDGGCQMRSGNREPYIHHVIRCAARASEFGMPSKVVIAMLLHDVIEDCPDPKKNDAFIRHIWPDAHPIVDALTHRWGDHDKGPEVDVMKQAYYANIIQVEYAPDGKLIDRTDNLRDMFNTIRRDDRKGDRKWAYNYLNKTIKEVDPLVPFVEVKDVVADYERAKLDLHRLLEG